jgi:general secretion pathway protein A
VYEKFFSLEETPFVLTPDPRVLFRSKTHHEILSALLYGITSQKGVMTLIGDVGTGKTTLARALLRELPRDVHSALVLNPHLSGAELVGAILDDLGVERRGATKGELMTHLSEHLLEAGARGTKVVVVVDEAQQMSVEALEQIRILSTLETPTQKLLQIVLAGQPELEALLKRHELRQLDQRVGVRCYLPPLDQRATERYIEHRLRAAGLDGSVPFTPGAMFLIYRHSRGIPRVINLVCDRALLAAYHAHASSVSAALARAAIGTLEGSPRRRPVVTRRTAMAAAAVGVLALGAVGAGAYRARGAIATTEVPHAPASAAIPAVPTPVSSTAPASAPAVAPAAPSEPRRDGPRLMARALKLWGVGGNLSDEIVATWPDAPGFGLDLPAVASRYQLTATLLAAATLADLRAISLPAFLEMQEATGPRWYLLSGLRADSALLTDAEGRATTRTTSEVTSAWTRRAWIVWRNVDQLPVNPAEAMTPTVLTTVALRLHKLGHLTGPLPESAEERFRAAVRDFQRTVGLPTDGQVGPRTTLALARVVGGTFNPPLASP